MLGVVDETGGQQRRTVTESSKNVHHSTTAYMVCRQNSKQGVAKKQRCAERDVTPATSAAGGRDGVPPRHAGRRHHAWRTMASAPTHSSSHTLATWITSVVADSRWRDSDRPTLPSPQDWHHWLQSSPWTTATATWRPAPCCSRPSASSSRRSLGTWPRSRLPPNSRAPGPATTLVGEPAAWGEHTLGSSGAARRRRHLPPPTGNPCRLPLTACLASSLCLCPSLLQILSGQQAAAAGAA